jgi:hypothetical protein
MVQADIFARVSSLILNGHVLQANQVSNCSANSDTRLQSGQLRGGNVNWLIRQRFQEGYDI